jgi:YfiH family protein
MGNIKNDGLTTVMNNRRLFYKILGIVEDVVALPDQIHSANVEIVSSTGIIPKTDALITSKRGLFLGVQTADCFPVFIYSPEKKIIGIVHAGWKGAVQNILTKTIEQMIKNLNVASSELFVVIGPGLQRECFEVRSDVYDQFPAQFLNSHQDESKRYLNLSEYLREELISQVIPPEQIYVSTDCTECNQEKYYSYRRDGEKSGRMMGIIGIRP